MGEALRAAHELVELGWCVLPARPGGKRPAGDWKIYQEHRPEGDELDQLFARFPGECNLWVATGRISLIIVVDLDNATAERYWRARLGDEVIDGTTCSKTTKGIHLFWSITPEQARPGWAVHPKEGEDPDGPSYDVRCNGGGVIVPPSVHQSGATYTWVRGPQQLQPAPAALLAGPDTSPAGEDRDESPRSLLSKLLASPPGPGGRNDWLTRVAGHLARLVPHNQRDAFDELLATVNRSLQDPLPQTEIDKTSESIWTSERDKSPDQGERPAASDNGWLLGSDTYLLTECYHKDRGATLEQWADFNIAALGVIRESDQRSVYQVRLEVADQQPITVALPSQVLGSGEKLSGWLHSYQATIAGHPNDIHGRTHPGTRLHRYLKAQNPPEYQTVDYLGWHDGEGFICHEGLITADGLRPHGSVVPHPRLVGWAPYRYGFVGLDDARSVLREVLTFHDEVVCSVFGAWCMAVLLKGHVMRKVSLFPVMAVEAPSESGKTSGFFPLMLQLCGAGNAGQGTIASLRDHLSSNRSGFGWQDDISDTSRLEELLRHSTAEGEMTKKGQDRTSQESVKLVGACVLSAESMGALHAEKALLDRCVLLEAPNPKHRRSVHDPDRAQWDDILALRERWNDDLCQIAGTVVQLALQQTALVDQLSELRPGTGRFSDKMAILRVGARVLAAITGDEHHIEIVDHWCAHAVDLGAENALTFKILPEYLADVGAGLQSSPQGAPVAYLNGNIVWYSEERLAVWWQQRYRNDARALQMGELHHLRNQRAALGIDGQGTRKNTAQSGRGDQRRYHQLSAELSAVVLERAGLHAGPGVMRGGMVSPSHDDDESLDFET